MKKTTFGEVVVRRRYLIFFLGLLLLIPSVLGMVATRINYDMLTYLPEDMDTVKGQDILLEDFGKGAFSTIIVEGMENKDVSALKEQIEQVDHVDSVIWYDSLLDDSVPMELLPEKYYDAFNNGDATMMIVFFDTSTSEDATITAIQDIRSIATKDCYITGMSALVTDLKELCEQEEPIYVALAVAFATLAMMVFMDSFLIPLVFLASIGTAILWNLGSNFFLGEISYITKALAAVLQLAVTMDYSIFLWHSYEEQKALEPDKNKAMATAIGETLTSVIGSSITTVAGFIALCFMTYELGADLGIVMAKGVLLGVIGCVTMLPAMILILDHPIEKTRHRAILPDMTGLAKVVARRFPIFLVIFAVILAPAYYGYRNTGIYYDMGGAVPKWIDSAKANEKMQESFDLATTHMILVDASLSQKEVSDMVDQINEVDGVNQCIGLSSLVGNLVPEEILPDELRSTVKTDDYQLLLVTSSYRTASRNVNRQITKINNIVKESDPNGMVIGEAPCTKDLITTTNRDFQVVTAVSILAIFAIILLVFKSLSLPVILVSVIEFAIFINLGIPFYTGTMLPFIAPICISTIQLGSTVDYAILMTTRYKRERMEGLAKYDAVTTALATSIPSIIVSAAGFFAATFGVAMYSNIDIISSMCTLMARGAVISMLSVIFILPAFLMLLDGIIVRTTGKMKQACVEQNGGKLQWQIEKRG